MLKIAQFDLLQDDFIEGLLERVKYEFATDVRIDATMCYEVVLQDMTFRCSYTDDEMIGIIKTCVDIIKELIEINEMGYTKEKFKKFNISNQTTNVLQQLNNINALYNNYTTAKLDMLFAKMTTYTCLGESYLMLQAAPGFQQIINVVFAMMLNDLDDENIWFSCLYYMICGAMRMDSKEI